MKILLDECVPVRLGKYLEGFTVSTVSKEQWTSLKNGKLMKAAIDGGFDVMLTVDKNLQYQQNLNEYNITIVVFDVLFNRLQDFTPLIPKFLEQLPSMEKKKAYNIK
jgi:hypothetical protein